MNGPLNTSSRERLSVRTPHAGIATRVRLPCELRMQIEGWSRDAYPREACGLLLGRVCGEVAEIAAVRRAHNLSSRHDRFEVDPGDYLAAEYESHELGLDVVGVWHSHPDRAAVLSAHDRASASPAWCYLIASTQAGGVSSLRCWRVTEALASVELNVSSDGRD